MAGFLLPGDAIPKDVKEGKIFSAGSFYNEPGTMIGGRQSKSGTAITFKVGSSTYYKITVTGLGFQPSVVVAKRSSDTEALICRSGLTPTGSYRNNFESYSSQITYTGSTSQGTGDAQFQVTSDGFTMIVLQWQLAGDQSGSSVSWLAIE